jgi:hypothetical protein
VVTFVVNLGIHPGVTTVLTDLLCRNATAEGKKLRKLHDGNGLYLWVYADGRKYWRFRYWVGPKEKCLSLGVFPRTSLKTARHKCAEEHERLDRKLDPAAERLAAKAAMLVADERFFGPVAMEWWSKQSSAWDEKHAADVKRRIEINLVPHLGKRPIDEISAPELLAVIRNN